MDAIIKSAAAQNLVGKELSDGWIVKEKKTKKDTDILCLLFLPL